MISHSRTRGFTLIELLLVLALIGIISGIAIPTFLGQRRRARVIGDAMSNSKVIAMMLETRRADTGVYGDVATYNWTAGSAVGVAGSLLPAFTPKGNSAMNYQIDIVTSGLAYTTTVFDPQLGGTTVFQTDQTGATLVKLY